MTKAALRAQLRSAVLDPEAHAQQSAMVRARTLALPVVRDAAAVALFMGTKHEPETAALFEALAGKSRWLPAVHGPTALRWCEVTALDQLRRSRWGLLEPPDAQVVFPPVEVVLMPGLAFDRSGGRLGWGRGFYDRALAAHPGVARVGLCLRENLLEQRLPVEAHDLAMHWVVSPDEVLVRRENTRPGGQ